MLSLSPIELHAEKKLLIDFPLCGTESLDGFLSRVSNSNAQSCSVGTWTLHLAGLIPALWIKQRKEEVGRWTFLKEEEDPQTEKGREEKEEKKD